MSSNQPKERATTFADLKSLRQRVERSPGCAVFPVLAEYERESGRPEKAVRIALAGLEIAPDRIAGQVALALARIDMDDFPGARAALAGVLEPTVAPHRASDRLVLLSQLEGTRARTLLASDGTQEALSDPRGFALVGSPASEPDPGEEEQNLDSPFATQSMASLLEKQGDEEGAREIRRVLSEGDESVLPLADGSRSRQRIARLERMLDRLKRRKA